VVAISWLPHQSGVGIAAELHEIKGFGERGRNRTFNLLIKSQLLCQLSYAPTIVREELPQEGSNDYNKRVSRRPSRAADSIVQSAGM
jgi:hypothetical protein